MLFPFYPNKLPIVLNPIDHITLLRKAISVVQSLEFVNQKMDYTPANHELITSFSWFESVESAKLEGTQADFDEVLEAQITKSKNAQIIEVQNYAKALQYGRNKILNENSEIDEALILQLHKIIMAGARGGKKGVGRYRTKQNDVSKISDNERTEGEKGKNISYIPPTPEVVPELMDNLISFIRENDFEPLIASAIIHAQFETIHPFPDGNGRVGRLLIPLYLLKHKTCGTKTIFISEELEKNKVEYSSRLNQLRTDDPDWVGWINFFLESIKKEADKQILKTDQIINVIKKYVNEDIIKKSDSAQSILISCANALITNSSKIVEETGFQNSTVNKWLKYFVEIGMLWTDQKKRHKVYWFPELLKIVQGGEKDV